MCRKYPSKTCSVLLLLLITSLACGANDSSSDSENGTTSAIDQRGEAIFSKNTSSEVAIILSWNFEGEWSTLAKADFIQESIRDRMPEEADQRKTVILSWQGRLRRSSGEVEPDHTFAQLAVPVEFIQNENINWSTVNTENLVENLDSWIAQNNLRRELRPQIDPDIIDALQDL